MAISPEALNLIKEFEGYLKHVGGGRVVPYLCPARVATIGWGSTFYENGTKVKLSDPSIDQTRATALLDHELMRVCAPAITTKVKVPLHPLMHGALMSFAFNVGTGALASSTLLRRINAQQWNDIPKEFHKWTRGGGRELPGLVRRRKAEAALFMRGVSQLGNRNWSDPLDELPPIPATEAKPSIFNRIARWFRRG